MLCSTCDRPRALDLFCGAGGASMGYHRAGFCVTGVDNRPMPRYPFRFVQADAMTYPLTGYALVHASPPCQDHMRNPIAGQVKHGTGWMLAATRERLTAWDGAWVIENVPGAAMRADYLLCGCMFGETPEVMRRRLFETSWQGFDLRPPCSHRLTINTARGNTKGEWYRLHGRRPTMADIAKAMKVEWMRGPEVTQAIPPAYTEYIGARALREGMHTMDLRKRPASSSTGICTPVGIANVPVSVSHTMDLR